MTQFKNALSEQGVIYKKISSAVCENCCAGKQHTDNFKLSENLANFLCELVHANLYGPLEVTYIGGLMRMITATSEKYI